MRNYKFLGKIIESLNLKNPRIQVTLFPGKKYKLPSQNQIVKRLVNKGLLEDLGEVKVKKANKKVTKEKPTIDNNN
ncbi:MAG: hypothetical protein J7647_26200 [Cyanobacteria bacterium SBLK]|nr:hypothetical protein [Cyanobacteria bacterium SBLK]